MNTTFAVSTGRKSLVTIAGGIVVGIALFLALNRVAALWWDMSLHLKSPLVALVLSVALVGLATYLANRYPGAGLRAGVALAMLVVMGLLTGDPGDLNIAGGGWTPGEILRFGARQPLTWACTAAVLAVSLARTPDRESALTSGSTC